MKITVNKPIELNVKTLRLNAGVRYPSDANIFNSEIDEFERDDMHNPMMPFLVNVNNEWRWRPEIDVETGIIKNWPNIDVSISYKICDEFECDILDEHENILHFFEGYVPSFFGVDEINYGDYIYMDIDKTGQIINWKCTKNDIEKLFND